MGSGIMNIYKQMNSIITYIEDNLLSNIKVRDLSKLTGLNELVIKNIFPLLVGCGISEYIRNRRLSICVDDLKSGSKVIDVALKYGYSSSEAFTRAFKKFHGLSPKNVVKDNFSFKLFPKKVFNQDLMSEDIKYNIYYNKKIVLYGVGKRIKFDTKNKDIPKFWKEVKKKYPIFNEVNRNGFLYREDDNSSIYYCLIEKEVEGLIKIELPQSNYISFTTSSLKSIDITNKIIKSYNEYIQSLKFKIRDIPVIEKYYNDYVELLISIK